MSDLEIRLLAHDIKIDNEQLSKLKQENEDLTVRMLELTKQIEAEDLKHIKLTDTHHQLTHAVQDLQFELTNHAEKINNTKRF